MAETVRIVRRLVSCPRCKGIVHGDAIRTGYERGRYWHLNCLTKRMNDDLQAAVRNAGHSDPSSVKYSPEEIQQTIDRFYQRVIVKVPGEDKDG